MRNSYQHVFDCGSYGINLRGCCDELKKTREHSWLSSFNTLENENNTINRDDKIVTECTRILDVSSESYD